MEIGKDKTVPETSSVGTCSKPTKLVMKECACVPFTGRPYFNPACTLLVPLKPPQLAKIIEL